MKMIGEISVTSFQVGDQVVWYDSLWRVQRRGKIIGFTPRRVVIEISTYVRESIDKANCTGGIPKNTIFNPLKVMRLARVKTNNLCRLAKPS